MSPQSVRLTDFTGGLHLRSSEFQLADNQSPEMLNIEIDPRRGFATRKGWSRWNASDIVTTPTSGNWAPRHAYVHPMASGEWLVYIANGSTIYASTSSASFANQSITVSAVPHLADFASWGDICYIATGKDNASYKRDGTSAAASLTAPANGTYNDTYTSPAGGYMPKADLVEGHLGYLFVASIEEDYDGGGTVEYPNRIRWSHPNEPEDWAQLDFLDILEGGDRITALKSFRDHLLIFKETSVWALYGYDADSWQLIEVSRSVGAPSPAAVTRSQGAVYFYSGSSRPGVFGYSGSDPVHVSDALEQALDQMSDHNDAWVAWMGRRLWCCLPWSYAEEGSGDSVFVWDPEVGEGAWMVHQPALGKLRCVMERSDIINGKPLGVIEGSSGAAAVMELEDNANPLDAILDDASTDVFDIYYRTGWQYDGEPDRQKGWLRPRYVVGAVSAVTNIDVDTYWDYDETNIRRQHVIALALSGAVTWNSFTWGDGTLWSSGVGGAVLRRTVQGRHLGWTPAVSLKFSDNGDTPGVPWSISGIILKYRARRFTT